MISTRVKQIWQFARKEARWFGERVLAGIALGLFVGWGWIIWSDLVDLGRERFFAAYGDFIGSVVGALTAAAVAFWISRREAFRHQQALDEPYVTAINALDFELHEIQRNLVSPRLTAAEVLESHKRVQSLQETATGIAKSSAQARDSALTPEYLSRIRYRFADATKFEDVVRSFKKEMNHIADSLGRRDRRSPSELLLGSLLIESISAQQEFFETVQEFRDFLTEARSSLSA